MIRFSNGDMFESGADALVSVPRYAKLFSDKEVVSEAYSKVLPLFRTR